MKDRTLSKREKKNLENFIDDNFDHIDRGRHPEIRVFCPFCGGGPRNDFSFDINLEKGVARCWRAENCAWKGSVESMFMDYYDIEFDQAEEILKGEKISEAGEMRGYLNQVKQSILEDDNGEYMSLLTEEEEQIDEWVQSAIPVSLSEKYQEICEWLDQERGYDAEEFLDHHSLFTPHKKSRVGGYVLFQVRTKHHRSYQAYAYSPETEPKVLAPKGYILPRFLYNYNSAEENELGVVFVTEGIFDAARLISWGLPAVCVFGTDVSEEQHSHLADIDKEEVCFCFDNGAAGNAKLEAGHLAKMVGDKDISVMKIEQEGVDPDELEQDQFIEYFENRAMYIGDNSSSSLLKKMSEMKRWVDA